MSEEALGEHRDIPGTCDRLGDRRQRPLEHLVLHAGVPVGFQTLRRCERRTTGRHVRAPCRFFRELRLLERSGIRSAGLGGVEGPFNRLHLMRDAASAVDMPAGPAAVPSQVVDGAAYASRSLLSGPIGVDDTGLLSGSGRAAVTHVSVLRSPEFDEIGELQLHAVHLRVSDGTGHLWRHVSVSLQEFYGQGIGRAIVELKMTRHANAAPGDVVRQVSWFGEIGRRAIEIRHQLEDMRSGEVLANTSSTTLVIDVEKRRSIDLPKFLTRRLTPAG